MSFTVTATQGGSTSAGIEAALLVFTGQAGSPIGASAGVTSATPSVGITPNESGSTIIGTLLTLAATLTPLAGTTFFETVAGGGLEYGPFHGTSSGTGLQTFGSSTATGISACALEIKDTPTLAAQSLTGFVSATAATSGAVTPAGGSLLALLVASNGGGSVTTMAISDTSGLGLTWTEQVKQDGAGNGYSGIWTAPMPAAGAPSGTVQPAATVAIRRRVPARLYQRGTLTATTNAQLFFQQPAGQAAVYSRRVPARAFIGRLKPIAGVNAPTTPGKVKPLTARADWPRRTLARAYVRFTPVTTTNPAPAPPVPVAAGADYDEARGFKRWLLWEV